MHNILLFVGFAWHVARKYTAMECMREPSNGGLLNGQLSVFFVSFTLLVAIKYECFTSTMLFHGPWTTGIQILLISVNFIDSYNPSFHDFGSLR